MPNAYVRSSGVVSQGRTWAVSINDRIVEGGFFSRDAAVASCLWWERNYREEEPAEEAKPMPAEFYMDDLGQGRR